MGTNAAAIKLEGVQTRLSAAGALHIGDLISWNTNAIDVPRDAAIAVFEQVGFKDLITMIEPKTALSRAVGEVRKPKGISVIPFEKPKGDTAAAFGIYVKTTVEGESGEHIECGARVRVESGQIVFLAPDGKAPIAEAMSHAEAIAARANHLLANCDTRDVSNAMVEAVRLLAGVPLRDRGGFYLLPPAKCDTWRQLEPGLRSIRVDPIRFEMHDAPTNRASASTAAKSALETEIAELCQELDEASREGMRKFALENRVNQCDALVAKAALFRDVLADKVADIDKRAMTLRQSFVQLLAGGTVTAFPQMETAEPEDEDAELFTIRTVD